MSAGWRVTVPPHQGSITMSGQKQKGTRKVQTHLQKLPTREAFVQCEKLCLLRRWCRLWRRYNFVLLVAHGYLIRVALHRRGRGGRLSTRCCVLVVLVVDPDLVRVGHRGWPLRMTMVNRRRKPDMHVSGEPSVRLKSVKQAFERRRSEVSSFGVFSKVRLHSHECLVVPMLLNVLWPIVRQEYMRAAKLRR